MTDLFLHLDSLWQEAEVQYSRGRREEAIKILNEIILNNDIEPDDADSITVKEQAVYRIAEIYVMKKESGPLAALLTGRVHDPLSLPSASSFTPHPQGIEAGGLKPFFALLPRAKVTKMVRKLFDSILVAGASLNEQKQTCLEMINWCKHGDAAAASAETGDTKILNERAKLDAGTNVPGKRSFLRLRLEYKLAGIFFEMGLKEHAHPSLRHGEAEVTLAEDENAYMKALNLVRALVKEVRRLDDRILLVDIHLLETKIYYALKNISKARAALVAAKTNANSVYVAPLSQAEIDLYSGILSAEEKDYKTAFSYLYEAFEAYHNAGDRARNARQALYYMLLFKIRAINPGSSESTNTYATRGSQGDNASDELRVLLQSKSILSYSGRGLSLIRGIAAAWQQKNTHMLRSCIRKYLYPRHYSSLEEEEKAQVNFFRHDLVFQKHLNLMLHTLMEMHLLMLIEPYRRVQISYLARLLSTSNTEHMMGAMGGRSGDSANEQENSFLSSERPISGDEDEGAEFADSPMAVAIDEDEIEARLSQLILDKKLDGIVDQQHGCLVVFDTHMAKRHRAPPPKGRDSDAAVNSAVEEEVRAKRREREKKYRTLNMEAILSDIAAGAVRNTAEEYKAQDVLFSDAMGTLMALDKLVTALFDKASGKFDHLIESNLQQRKKAAAEGKGEAAGR